MVISSNNYSISKEDGVLVFCFGDEQNYFMIQVAHEFDEQDIELGMDTYYIEMNDQSFGGYGGIESIQISKEKMKFELNAKGRKYLNEEFIELEIDMGSCLDLKKELATFAKAYKINMK